MMNVRSRPVSISLSHEDEANTNYDGLLHMPPCPRRGSSLTLEMLESVTSDEIKKRREDRKAVRKRSIDLNLLDVVRALPSPLLLKRSPSLILLHNKLKKDKPKTKKKKR
eukprot:143486_1